jgi:hypothetical protein
MGLRCLAILLTLGSLPLALADDAEPIPLVDSTGKEIKLTNVKWTAGVRRLAYLADPKGTTDEAKKGPLALEIREPLSTTFQKGVVTLVPLSSVESVNYDYQKLKMSVAVKGQPEVGGTLQFQGINVIRLDGKSGDRAAKFTGGVPKDGFRSISFPGAMPLPPRAGGSSWSVRIVQPKEKDPTLTVRNIRALYVFPGGIEKRMDALPVRKGEPLQLKDKIKKVEFLAVDTNTMMAVLEATIEGGVERIIAVPLTLEQEKRTGMLTGLLGEVDAGWKLFPLHAIKSIQPSPR